MSLRTIAIATGLAALLGGAAFAQSSPEMAPPQQPAPYMHHHHRHHEGVLSVIRGEVDAGRISHKEGALLMEKIKAMKAERRAQRQARYGNYEQGDMHGNPPPPPPPSQQAPQPQ